MVTLLYYSPISWPHLEARPPSFPHSNELFSASKGVALYRDSLDLFRLAEDVGFDWLGVGEEHMNAYGVVPNPCLIAAALAFVTERAQLCVMGNPLPLLSPLRVAEEYAMIDVLSNGRLVAGFPRGVPQNYAAYGVSYETSRDRLSEGIELVLKAWRHPGPFNWDGKEYQFNNVSIWPQPTKSPDIILSSRSPESVSLAVQHRAIMGEVYVQSRDVLTGFIANAQRYTTEAMSHGWRASSDRFLLSVPCVIARTSGTAMSRALASTEYARTILSGSFEQGKLALAASADQKVQPSPKRKVESLEERIEYGGVICGDPDEVIDQIGRLQAATGVGVLGLQMQWANLTSVEVRESLQLFGKYVRANVSEHGAAGNAAGRDVVDNGLSEVARFK